ncbi:methionine-synthesizing 5- methyltetrahydropteroyltriglutamate--homocysteine methyltransferase [Chytriomyces hyalinus]|nr:methionine-synthesizing 5- methyltetrahydropteroyltriglutamate--homocysteine methyltransferase [Chytriomyces hyalinus]
MPSSSILGFPRMGANRDLKHLVEGFWKGTVAEADLISGAKALRATHWKIQKDMGIDHIPSNDFSLYDHILDAAVTFGAVPPRYTSLQGLDLYFAMARGLQRPGSVDVASLPMSKYFDTNYHYVPVPLTPATTFSLAANSKPVQEYFEAKALGIQTRPYIVGPMSFLLLARASKDATAGFSKLSLLYSLVDQYAALISELDAAGAEWIQLDEPHLVMDLSAQEQAAYTEAYTRLASKISGKSIKVLVATYFEGLESQNAELAFGLPGVHAIHIDLVRGLDSFERVLVIAQKTDKSVSLGVVDGRNVWKADLGHAVGLVQQAVEVLGAKRVIVASSCSLLHSPHSLDAEKAAVNADLEMIDWMSFAVEKLSEVAVVTKAVNFGSQSVKEALDANKKSVTSRLTSTRIHNPAVQERLRAVTPAMTSRKSEYVTRRAVQTKLLNLPKYPTTTIGSFPQTASLRRIRAQFKKGSIKQDEYERLLKEEIATVVKFQEKLDIDVLVHGEAERNDMVEYFGEMLNGVGFTKNGWVQSYGSRCVKPPVIYGDVSRPSAMTVAWTKYAQSLTNRPMKGMLTGPLTILCWSFVRDDQPREYTAKQIALAVRDEVVDLEAAGIKVIQIDEPAIREGLPLRRGKWNAYLKWAVDSFLLASCGVQDGTQIHSHMCYSDFEDIMDAIIQLDCDVLSIESAKSDLKLLQAFQERAYPNELGPGVFDIHTQRVAPQAEMKTRVDQMKTCLAWDRIWINPDCDGEGVMPSSSILGFPRMGANRDLKHLVEGFWKGTVAEADLISGAKALRATHWKIQKDMGIDHIPSNDFSLYDHILDAAVTFGAVPPRYTSLQGLDLYFAMARGLQRPGSVDVASLPMSKYFDTNYHYVPVPLTPATTFSLAANSKPVQEYFEAKALGIQTRPYIVGPMSFLLLARASKDATAGFSKLSLLYSLVDQYAALISELDAAGAEWIQLDEPHLVMDLSAQEQAAYTEAYTRLASKISGKSIKVLVATYFEGLESQNAELAFGLPGVHAIHIDLVRGLDSFERVLVIAQKTDKSVSLGVVDGRNVWKADLGHAVGLVQQAVEVLGAKRVIVASSCSLLHSPHSLDAEKAAVNADLEMIDWMSFAVEKLSEVAVVTKAVNFGSQSVKEALDANKKSVTSRLTSTRIHNPAVQERLRAVTPAMTSRKSEYVTRRAVQTKLLNLPKYPTTTIGSFPQTASLRRIRAQFKKGSIKQDEYERLLKEEIATVVKFQEKLDIDVLVHGEAERNDMVEYFGEMLNGVGFTKNGWVQSYGSRCVKPPVIYGDVSRPSAMTVAWTKYAQSLTNRPMKGMLTGPLTILCWSFVRDDQPREYTAKQIALAVRDEVVDLEAAGIKVIQIDEPAIREGLPLRRGKWNAYLKWAVDSFLLASCGVQDGTQIHSHMCYSDFEDIMDAIIQLDCDVLSIESAKSDLKLLQAFQERAYPNELGPGVFDIHTQRVAPQAEMKTRVDQMKTCLAWDRIWINPDCGLKTRGWEETEAVLKNMVQTAKEFRAAAASA